jgi:signal transduction histidine kinase
LTFVALVSLPLLLSGLVGATLTWRQQQQALADVQLARADASAVRIQQFLREIELQLRGLALLPWTADSAVQRRQDALRVLRLTPAISDIVLIDADGRERLAESRLELSRSDLMSDRSASPAVAGARSRGAYHSDVTFRRDSEPFMTIAVAGAAGGVAIAEVSLKHIWDVVSTIRVGDSGIAYVVDPTGRLIAHPDIQLVLRNTDLSATLRAFAVDTGMAPAAAVRTIGTRGVPVVATSRQVQPVGWSVVVEQPLGEADEPLRSAVRGALWVAAASLVFALMAAIWSAWRMARPLRQLAAGAAQIGSGQLAHRITLQSGDELQQLGDRFNAMAAELQASYAGLEQQVEQRTRALSEANRAKSRLLAAASHDLRQPLHALNLLVAQLHDVVDPAERERLGRRVEAVVASINGLFDGLLDVSKLDAGVVQPRVAPLPVQRILDRIDISYAGAARAKDLELRIRPSSAWVQSDPILLERIVGNLVGNAIRYTSRGAVLVGCRHAGGQLRLGVWDTGIGIPPDQQDRVFEEFYQLDSGGAARGEGLGLGLSIVARLATLLGHPVHLRSAVGRGSCFGIDLPLAAPQWQPAADADIAPIEPLRGRRVLVVDNDDQVLDSSASLLASWGCEVRAHNGADGVTPPDAAAPEVALVDMHLGGGLDGIAVVQQLRRHYGDRLPALVMTGDVSVATRERVRAHGLQLLEKPLSAPRLRAALTGVLQRA